MTDFRNLKGRNRDVQDLIERGLWNSITYVDGSGAHLKVEGTGSMEEEVPLINFGYGFNLPEGTNSEVMLMGMGSDPNQKMAMMTLPRDRQRQWPAGAGGVQDPMDAERYLEMKEGSTHLNDGVFTVGPARELTLTISGGNVSIATSGDMTISASRIAFQSASLTHNGTNISDDHVHSGVETGGSSTQGPQ